MMDRRLLPRRAFALSIFLIAGTLPALAAEPVYVRDGMWTRPGSAIARDFAEALDENRFEDAMGLATRWVVRDFDVDAFAQRHGRGPLGKALCRVPIMQQYVEPMQADGYPGGFIVRVRTRFEHGNAVELFRLARGPDHAYRVDEYTLYTGENSAFPCPASG